MNLLLKKTIWSAIAAWAFLSLSAQAATTALIDFGNASGLSTTFGGLTYNAPAAPAGSPKTTSAALNNTSGGATGWTIAVTNTAGGTSDAGFSGSGATYAGTLPSQVSSFDPNAVRDNIFFNAGDQAAGQLTVTLTGLDITKTYDLLFYGSRASAGGTQTWNLITGTGTAPQVQHSSTANSATVVNWTGIAPNSGTISFTISVTGGVGALNFGQITEVPEPSSLALLALGSLCMLRRRRNEY